MPTTDAPARASPVASAWPIPELAPVTQARLPARSNMLVDFSSISPPVKD